MDILKLIGVAIICAVIIIYLKSVKPELAFAAAAASGIILLMMIMAMLSDVIGFFRDLSGRAGIDSLLIGTVLKIVGIGYLVEFSAGLIEDFGSKSVADKLLLGGKVLILIVALPILQSVLSLIVSILE